MGRKQRDSRTHLIVVLTSFSVSILKNQPNILPIYSLLSFLLESKAPEEFYSFAMKELMTTHSTGMESNVSDCIVQYVVPAGTGFGIWLYVYIDSKYPLLAPPYNSLLGPWPPDSHCPSDKFPPIPHKYLYIYIFIAQCWCREIIYTTLEMEMEMKKITLDFT